MKKALKKNARITPAMQSALDTWRAGAEETRGQILTLRQLLMNRRDAETLKLLDKMHEGAMLTVLSFQEAGASPQGSHGPLPVVPPEMIGTLASRHLFGVLTSAHVAARVVDEERYGEDGPRPFAGWIALLLSSVQEEFDAANPPVEALPPPDLNVWRETAEQLRVDLVQMHRFLTQRRDSAALELMREMIHLTLLLGMDLERAGAARPVGGQRLVSGSAGDAHQD